MRSANSVVQNHKNRESKQSTELSKLINYLHLCSEPTNAHQ